MQSIPDHPIDTILWGIHEQYRRTWLEERDNIFRRVYDPCIKLGKDVGIESSLEEMLLHFYVPLSEWVFRTYCGLRSIKSCPIILGLVGPPGAGKTSTSLFLQSIFQAAWELSVVILSLDNFYKTQEQRAAMNSCVHDLFRTRGVPGTHDLDLGHFVFKSLLSATEATITAIPVFNKSPAVDDRLPKDQWQTYHGRPDMIIFEGWCVGAKPQPQDALQIPVNSLEQDKDPKCVWRSFVNEQLRTDYQKLFDYLDVLIMIKVPSWSVILAQRWEQEQQRKPHLSEARFHEFLMYYQRLCMWMHQEMPGRADMVLEIDRDRNLTKVAQNRSVPPPGLQQINTGDC